MQTSAEDTHLPVDIDAQPPVQAAAALRPVIRGYHEEIEREQRLPKALVEQLHAAGCYRLVIPRELGGLQADPLTYLRVVELLSEGAGSVGWNLANNSIGQLITLGLPDEGVQEIFAPGADTVIAGTALPGGGQAVPVAGGYRVSGRWRFGSGCQESSWMLGSFQILDGSQPRRNPEGTSVYWRGVFPRSEAQVVEGSWDVSGLRGTGSFDWTVEDVFLPERRTMAHTGAPLDNQWKRWPGITYALPTQAWVGPHHSAVIAELWSTVAAGKETTLEQRARCRLAAVYAADNAREAMDLMYRHGGSTSFQRESRLAECWRDLHVVGQTVTIAPEWYPIGGRVYLGMDPGPRLR